MNTAPLHLDLKHLRTLVTLVETGSLSTAAERLHLTQSALSHQLKGLEERLGASLYVRKSRPLRLTRQGERLLQLAREVLPRMEAAQRDLQRMTCGQAGRLHIAIECHSCFAWLMPALDRYRQQWPEVELDLVTGFAFDPLPPLARGEVDLVITSDTRPLEGIAYLHLFGYQALLAMHRDHPLATNEWIEPEELASETLITYPVEPERLDIFTRFMTPAGVHPGEVRNTELTLMMIQLVASGRGVAALPDWALAEYLQRDYVVARPLGRNGLHGRLFAAMRQETRSLPWMEGFIEIAREGPPGKQPS